MKKIHFGEWEVLKGLLAVCPVMRHSKIEIFVGPLKVEFSLGGVDISAQSQIQSQTRILEQTDNFPRFSRFRFSERCTFDQFC